MAARAIGISHPFTGSPGPTMSDEGLDHVGDNDVAYHDQSDVEQPLVPGADAQVRCDRRERADDDGAGGPVQERDREVTDHADRDTGVTVDRHACAAECDRQHAQHDEAAEIGRIELMSEYSEGDQTSAEDGQYVGERQPGQPLALVFRFSGHGERKNRAGRIGSVRRGVLKSAFGLERQRVQWLVEHDSRQSR